MWLKSFKFNDKALSDVELIVLASLSDSEFKNATDLIEELDHDVPYWKPERGTIYPLLHRLVAQDLIERSDGPMKFKRKNAATTFLSSLLSSDGLLQQFNATTSYLEKIAVSMIDVDPFAASDFMKKFNIHLSQLSQRISKMQVDLNISIKDEGWTEIDVE